MPRPEYLRENYEAALGLAWLGTSAGHSLLRLLKLEGVAAVWGASTKRLVGLGIAPTVASAFGEYRRGFDPGNAERLLTQAGAWFVPFGAAEYPPELVHLEFPPAGLFVRGSKECLQRLAAVPRVTIVGTRKPSADGLRATEAFTAAFCGRGVAVVSGMALGIDGRAHRVALDSGGLTVAVLGCGIDVVYPRSHGWLHQKIARKGLLMSELPPGTMPTRWTFPHRNRILAALGDAVMVVEAPVRSGALQTANSALNLGRPVFSVPGSIFVDTHVGCHQLLRDGAAVAAVPGEAVEDFLAQTRIDRGERLEAESRVSAARDGVARTFGDAGGGERGSSVLEALAACASGVDGLVESTGLAVRDVMAALAGLELAGLVVRTSPGVYARAP
jgi:DNA processing protein